MPTEVRIDFSNSGTAEETFSASGDWYTRLGGTNRGATGTLATALVDIANVSTPFTFVQTEGAADSGFNGVDTPGTGDAAWVTWTLDTQWLGNNIDRTCGFGNLDPAKLYTIEAVGSRETTGTVRTVDFTVGGSTQKIDIAGNVSQTAKFTDLSPDGSNQILMTISTAADSTTTFNYANAMRLIEQDAGAGPTLGTVPATAFPGQSRTVTGSGFGATQGTGGLTIGEVAQTITAWSDTSITFTTVLGTNNYGTGKTLEVTTDAATTVSDTIELVADTANGFGYVDMSSPNTTDESSVAFGATPTVVTGDQFEWEDFNNLGNLTVDAQGFVSNVDTAGTFRGRFWDATDSTWGAVETFTASVPGEEDTWPFGKGINPAATKNWTWGRRHPKTNMRVRIYK